MNHFIRADEYIKAASLQKLARDSSYGVVKSVVYRVTDYSVVVEVFPFLLIPLFSRNFVSLKQKMKRRS